MKKLLLAAALLASTAISAQASYICSYAKQTAGRPDNNPVVGSIVSMNNDNTRWNVVHKLADGEIIDRSTQYDLTNRSTDTVIRWAGMHLRHPNLWMEGVFTYTAPGHAVYTETLYDGARNNKVLAQDVAQCEKYVEVQAPAPTSAPAPTYNPGGSDAVPFRMSGNAIHVQVTMGGTAVDMVLDTGAAMTSINTALANQLIASGQATELAPLEFTMANGTKETDRVISIKSLTIGSHTRTNVSVSVSEGMQLLGLPVLNAIGKFTIDAESNQLIFG